MPSTPFSWQSRVRFADTDASARIFYVSLLRHFDAAETEFLRHIGCSYRDLETRELSFPRVRVECDFTSMLRFDDLMDIEVWTDYIGRTSFRLGFRVAVEGREAARAKLTIVTINRREGRPIPIPEKLRVGLETATR